MSKQTFLKSIKYIAEGFIVKILFKIFKLLPMNIASNIGGFIAKTLGPKIRITKVAQKNLQLAMPELNEFERKTIICKMWENLGRVAMEFPHIYNLTNEEFKQRVTIMGDKNLSKYFDTGAIFFSGHIGNWEIAPRLLLESGLNISLVYRHANNKIVDQLICMERSRHNITIIPKGEKAGRKIIKTIKDKKTLAMLVDQKMNDGIKVPFFGHMAMTAPAIARLALNFNCPLVPIQVIRTKGANYIIKTHPALDIVNTGNKEQDIYQIMAKINLVLEGWIKENPEQWFWLHKRWG